MDEWQLEMQEIQRNIDRLEAAKGDLAVIAELEAEVRILQSFYSTALELFDRGRVDAHLRADFARTEMGAWNFVNVYSFVYERAMEVDTGSRELASVIPEVDYLAMIRELAR